MGGRRERRRVSSSEAMGKRIICSTTAILQLNETGQGGQEGLLMTSTVFVGQARLSGSFLTTSAVLKMPWMEQALTLNW